MTAAARQWARRATAREMEVRLLSSDGRRLHRAVLPRRRPGRPLDAPGEGAADVGAGAGGDSEMGLYEAARRVARRARRMVYRLV